MAIIDLEVPPSADLGLPLGWFSADDVGIYRRLIESIPNKSAIVEIGVWQGRSLCSIAKQIIAKKLRVFAVDTFEGTPKVQVVHNCNRQMRQIFLKNVKKFGFAGQLTILQGDSSLMAGKFRDQAALILIDGDHKTAKVTSDIKAWWPRVRNGGILSGHDFSIVAKAVQKNLGSVKHEKEMWWVFK